MPRRRSTGYRAQVGPGGATTTTSYCPSGTRGVEGPSRQRATTQGDERLGHARPESGPRSGRHDDHSDQPALGGQRGSVDAVLRTRGPLSRWPRRARGVGARASRRINHGPGWGTPARMFTGRVFRDSLSRGRGLNCGVPVQGFGLQVAGRRFHYGTPEGWTDELGIRLARFAGQRGDRAGS